MEAIVDPYGLRTTFRSEQGHIRRIFDPSGRYLQINYTTIPYSSGMGSAKVIESVQAWDGRGNVMETVNYHYTERVTPGIVDVTFLYLTRVDYDDQTHADYDYYPGGQSTNNRWSVTAGRMMTCKDVRFAGPMKQIRYVYLLRDEDFYAAWGQIKAEQTLDGQTVAGIQITLTFHMASLIPVGEKNTALTDRNGNSSTVTIRLQAANFPALQISTHRERLSTPLLFSYAEASTANHYLKILTDFRGKETRIEKSSTTGAVMSVKRSNAPPVVYHYTEQENPYYLASKTDQREKTTQYHPISRQPPQ